MFSSNFEERLLFVIGSGDSLIFDLIKTER